MRGQLTASSLSSFVSMKGGAGDGNVIGVIGCTRNSVKLIEKNIPPVLGLHMPAIIMFSTQIVL
jgi:hypothetical protein